VNEQTYFRYGSQWYGPYPSKQAAIADARLRFRLPANHTVQTLPADAKREHDRLTEGS
jgi:hypothetical protein